VRPDGQAARAVAAAEAWLDGVRATGRARFEALGLPTRKLEAWRYFPTRSLRGLELLARGPEGGGADAGEAALDALDALLGGASLPGVAGVAVLVDGHFDRARSSLAGLPDGVRVEGLAAALARDADGLRGHLGAIASSEGQAMLAANEASLDDGLVVSVAPGATVREPILALHLASGARPVVHARELLVLGRGAEATVISSWTGDGGEYAVNAVTEVALGEGARLRHVKLQEEHARALHVGHVAARVARDARFDSYVLSLGGEAARTSVRSELAGAGAECRLDGLYIGQGQQRHDIYTEIDHLVPHGTSSESYAGILDDRSAGNFLGVVYIREGARRSATRQMSRSLLLSEGAQANAKPQLEIDNDDVTASHGATVGQLDATAVYYLMSRGLAPVDARALLTVAFAREALAGLGDGAWADVLRRRAVARVLAGGAAGTALGLSELTEMSS